MGHQQAGLLRQRPQHRWPLPDLGETQADNLASNHWSTTGAQYPSNTANSLYNGIIASYPDARYISQVTQALSPLEAFGIYGGEDYAKIESAPSAVVVGIYPQQPARLRLAQQPAVERRGACRGL